MPNLERSVDGCQARVCAGSTGLKDSVASADAINKDEALLRQAEAAAWWSSVGVGVDQSARLDLVVLPTNWSPQRQSTPCSAGRNLRAIRDSRQVTAAVGNIQYRRDTGHP